MQIASGAVVDLNGNGQTIGSLSGAGTFTNSNTNSAAPLTIGGDSTSQVFSGMLASATPSLLSLNKTGSGVQTLAGTSSYAGGTTINSGAPVFSGAAALPSVGTITINAGGSGRQRRRRRGKRARPDQHRLDRRGGHHFGQQ